MVDSENVSLLSASDLAMVLLVRADGSDRAMPTVRLSEIGAVVEELAGLSRVREALADTGHPGVQIMPHLIFHSRLYDAYRQTMDAAPASGERCVFQIDPARPQTAVRTSLGSVDEGADMLLLEPALFCGDVLTALKQACRVPIAPFSVSGEYLRLRSEGESRLLVELFTMLKRSGADQIITYAAARTAPHMRLPALSSHRATRPAAPSRRAPQRPWRGRRRSSASPTAQCRRHAAECPWPPALETEGNHQAGAAR